MGIITDILKDIPLSAVLRERLVDQEKKMSILETENAALKTENLALKNENSDLKAIIENLRQEIQRRDDIIQQEKSHGILLEPIEEKILLLLHNHTKLTLEQVTHKIETSQPLAQMHLKKLFDGGMVISLPANRKWYWQIKENGTRYLRNHNLITQQGVQVDAGKPRPT